MADCTFCKIITKQLGATIVHEDERTLAFLDIAQVNPGHVLVASKAHSSDFYELSDADTTAVFSAARRIAHAIRDAFSPHGLSVYQANGAAAGQQVFHFHVHLIPRYENDAVLLNFPRTTLGREKLDEYGAQIRTKLG